MDEPSKGSTIVCQDQEIQHKEEEKQSETVNVIVDKRLSNTDRQSKNNLIECQNEVQHTNIGEENNVIDEENNTDQETLLKGEYKNNMNEASSAKQHSNTGLNIKDSILTCQKQEIQLKEGEEATAIYEDENLKKLQSYEAQQSKGNPIPCQDQETQHVRETLEMKAIKESASRLEMLKEIAIKTIDLNIATCSTAPSLHTSLMSKKSCVISTQPQRYREYDPKLPVIVINSPTNRSPITIQPSRTFLTIQSSISPKSLITPLPNQPQSLFLQALAILNESSISLAILNKTLKSKRTETENPDGMSLRYADLTPPDSLTSAPPSYSFVLRQSAARRRPRLMGTFIPSPSFVTKTPPPNYAAAFDIYVDSPLPPQPTRIYHFGFSAMPIICPECGYVGLTAVTSKITLCTHLCALLLCLFCCWVCAPLPYIMSSCKDVYHYCRNCRNFLGMYSPSNPETPYPVG